MKSANQFTTQVLYAFLLFFLTANGFAQVVQKFGSNSESINENAILELESTTKGFLLPRMNGKERESIKNPIEGLMIWCTDCSPTNESEISIWMTKEWKGERIGEWKGLLISDLPLTHLFLGNGNGKASAISMNGDITIDGVGTTTITPNVVTYSKIQNVNPNKILGRSTNSVGIVEEIPMTGTGNVVMSNSPTFTGIPLAPSAPLNTNTNQIATTAFVLANTDNYYTVNANQQISTTSSSDVVVAGMSLTPGAGTYSVTFNGEFTSAGSGTTSTAVTDLEAAYQVLKNKTTTALHANSFGSGETLIPGVYQTSGAGSLAGSLILNGTANDLFIFKINGAFSTSVGSSITLTGGAQVSNVFWVAISAGAISIATTNQMKGSFIARDGAALIANGSTLEGRLLSNVGAVSTDTNTISIPLGTSTFNLGVIGNYVLFTGSGALSNTGTSTITGNIGTNLGPITGFEAPTVVNGITLTPQTENTIGTTSYSLYQNGSLIANSTRKSTSTNGQIILSGIATVTDGQAIDVRWKTTLGEVKLENRILTLIKVR
jgi:Ice-binding-like